MDREIVLDRRLQLPGASMGTSPDLFLRESGKPPLRHVKPGSACRGEVHMITGALRQPRMNRRGLMRAVVVQNHMDVQGFRNRTVYPIEKLPKLNIPVPSMALPDHFPRPHIQRSKEGCRPVPAVVMGAPLNLTRAHRENRLKEKRYWTLIQ